MEFNELEAEPIIKEQGGEIWSTSRKMLRRLNQMAFISEGHLSTKRKPTILKIQRVERVWNL